MAKNIGPYEILERIDPDGYTVVYRGVEDMGHGIQRQAALKVLRGVRPEDTEAMDQLLREAGMLLDVSTCPNIVTIYKFGVDQQEGPWIAMELAGRSLKHYLNDEAADPSQVRALVRDVLQALAVVHDKGILHRDLKPNNILSTMYGQWKVADFGLARQQASEDTMAMATVKYAAPEMLDSRLNAESPAMDLYSLGMVAYEFALGQKLFREQFPSVYDPDVDESRSDDRPKWMYWHTSIQMTVPPVAELIEDFPKDLSDLIAGLMAKQVRERVPSAMKALASLGEVRARIDVDELEGRGRDGEERGSSVRTLGLALVAVLLIAAVAGYLYLQINTTPIVTLVQDSGRYEAASATITVAGRIENVPRNGSVVIKRRDGTPFPVVIDDEGRFSSDVTVPKLGEIDALLEITRPGGALVASRIIRLVRQAPERVDLTLSMEPPVENVQVALTPAAADEPILGRSDSNGLVRLQIPYGGFALRVTHVCYRPISMTGDSGIDAAREQPIYLEPIPSSAAKALQKEVLEKLPEVEAQIQSSDPAVVNMGQDRLRFMREAIRCHPFDSSDPEENAKLAKLASQLERAAQGETGALASAVETVGEINDYREQKRLAGEGGADGGDADGSVAKSPEQQRADLIRELNEALERGDVEAADRIRKQLMDSIPDDDDPVNQALRAQLAAVGEGIQRARDGDPTGLASALAAAKGAETIATLAAAAAGEGGGVPWAPGEGPGLDAIDQMTLLRLPADLLKAFLEVNIPRGALTVDIVPKVSKLRVRGVVFSDDELETLNQRLKPAMPRLELEVRVDAWAICRRLSEQLAAAGVEGLRVHAYLAQDENLLYVVFRDDRNRDDVIREARNYVFDRDLAVAVPTSSSE